MSQPTEDLGTFGPWLKVAQSPVIWAPRPRVGHSHDIFCKYELLYLL